MQNPEPPRPFEGRHEVVFRAYTPDEPDAQRQMIRDAEALVSDTEAVRLRIALRQAVRAVAIPGPAWTGPPAAAPPPGSAVGGADLEHVVRHRFAGLAPAKVAAIVNDPGILAALHWMILDAVAADRANPWASLVGLGGGEGPPPLESQRWALAVRELKRSAAVAPMERFSFELKDDAGRALIRGSLRARRPLPGSTSPDAWRFSLSFEPGENDPRALVEFRDQAVTLRCASRGAQVLYEGVRLERGREGRLVSCEHLVDFDFSRRDIMIHLGLEGGRPNDRRPEAGGS